MSSSLPVSAPVAPPASVIRCPEGIIAGSLLDKDTRHEIFKKVAGGAGSMEPEKFQRSMIEKGTGLSCKKTDTRINLRTNTLRDVPHPNKEIDGFDYSEDFDGQQDIKGAKVLINLKCIVGKGGAQTRSLREVYWFVEGQFHVLKADPTVHFANILDGDEAHAVLPKFQYLANLPEFVPLRNRIYIGDLKGYFEWVAKTFSI
jgi:hypothetical protein